MSAKIHDLDNQLLIAKKKGDIESINKIEVMLKQESLFDDIQVEYDTSRHWVIDTTNKFKLVDIELSEYRSIEKTTLTGSNDIYIANSSENEKCVSLSADPNGDLYAVYEVFNTDINMYTINIRRSTNNGQSWTYWKGWKCAQCDLLFPSITINRGFYDRFMIVFYFGDKSSLGLISCNIDDPSDYILHYINVTEVGGSENIRPKIVTDPPNVSTWYSYIIWIEEDGGFRGANDLYYSRWLFRH